jgi:hypothetical protein
VVVFALEALPEQCEVENAFLLSPSVSADYDLTRALGSVRHRMYVFTSKNDSVLRYLVPMVGTADRASGGATTAGLYGFRTPVRSSADTPVQYAKLVHVHWNRELARKGHAGGHTDVVSAQFVREYIAPLVMARATRSAVTDTRGKVRNPDYDRWANFAPGSWIRWEGHQSIGGDRRPLHIKATLVEKQEDTLVIERVYAVQDGDLSRPARVQEFIEKAWIEPGDHPLTHPAAESAEDRHDRLTVKGKTLECEVKTLNINAEFEEWGRNISATMHLNDEIPGGVVKVNLQSHKGTEPFEFSGQVVDYEVVSK